MPDVYTSTSTVPKLVVAAYDRYMRLALRSVPQYRQFADSRPEQQTSPGSSVIFTFYSDLADATTELNEVTDPEMVQIPDPTNVTVTLAERGNYSVLTKKLRAFSLDGKLDTNAANMIAFNMASSVDALVATELAKCTNIVSEEGGSLVATSNDITNIAATDVLKARDIRRVVTKLRAKNVVPATGDKYAVVAHPEVIHDLRIETGSTGWRTVAEYQAAERVFAGQIGDFEGATFIETPRALKSERGTDATPDAYVYDTFVFGKEALAEAVADEPHMVIGGNIPDPLNRKVAMGWTGILGHALFRPEALWKIWTSSSVA